MPPKSPLDTSFGIETWSRVHGFYAIMGGLALRPVRNEFLPGNIKRVTLTPAGLRFLFEHTPHLIPHISKEDIQDKSKADGVEKFLICAQATWFCVSSIARIANGLPITLLELNAIAHAACALLIYTFWWSKPLNIFEPTVTITGDGLDELIAYLWMSSHLSSHAEGWKGHDISGGVRDEFYAMWPFERPHISDLVFQPRSVDNDGDYADPNLPQLAFPGYSLSHRSFNSPMTFSPVERWLYQTVQKRVPISWLPRRLRFPPGFGVRKTAITHLSPTLLRRWELAYKAIQRFGLQDDLAHRHTHMEPVIIPFSGTRGADERLTLRIGNHAVLFPSRGAQPFHFSVLPSSKQVSFICASMYFRLFCVYQSLQ